MDIAFNDFVRRIEKRVSEPVNVMEIGPLTYAVDLSAYNLTVYYYLPGSVRFRSADISVKKYIHLDEDIWLNKSDLVLNRILNKIGQAHRVAARSGIVARIDKKTTISFLEEHHLHSPTPGKYRYGLFVEGELMSIAVFSGGRLMRHTDAYRSFECIRFCTKQGYVVVGGLSKLLKAFSRDFQPSDVMTYVDLDWSDGRLYEKLGFENAGLTEPQHYLVNRENHQRIIYKAGVTSSSVLEDNENCYVVANSGSLKMIKRYFV